MKTALRAKGFFGEHRIMNQQEAAAALSVWVALESPTNHPAGVSGMMDLVQKEVAGLPIAVGVGMSIKAQKNGRVCMVFFGDGASNEGAFHEALNMASIWKLPVVFVCENNKYGMSMDIGRAVCADPVFMSFMPAFPRRARRPSRPAPVAPRRSSGVDRVWHRPA